MKKSFKVNNHKPVKLIIQIPCYNEEKALPETLKDLPTTIPGIDLIETLIINDGSSDKTVEIAKKHKVTHIISQPSRRGLEKDSLQSQRNILIAGVGLGLGICMRLDSVFGAASLGLPLLLIRPFHLKNIILLGLGCLSLLLFLSWSNYLKFNSISPFSYGPTLPKHSGTSGIGPYLLILFLVISAVVFFLMIWHTPTKSQNKLYGWFSHHKLMTVLLISASTIIILFIPAVMKLINWSYQLLIGMRIRDLNIAKPALMRTPNGGMIYLDGLKKSLTPNCPYLILLPLSIWLLFKKATPIWKIAVLLGAPCWHIIMFGYHAWHGSVALNMRYLTPIHLFSHSYRYHLHSYS